MTNQNQLSFDVQFSKEDILRVLENPAVTDLVVYGTYTYTPELGINVWTMNAFAEGADNGNKNLGSPIAVGCIKPCPSK